MTDAAPLLFRPLKLSGLTVPNRVVVSPMCMYMAQGGQANDFHLVHLGQYALAGVGLILTEATAVSPEGRITPEDLGLWDDSQIAGLGRVTDFIHAQGGRVGVQLAHAGRKASTFAPWRGRGAVPPEQGGWTVVGPTEEAFHERYPVPVSLSEDDLARVVAAWVAATKRAEIAGFDAVEIHAAHGYLLHQFLSPLSNTRSDRYGGSLENRARLLMDVVRGVRRAWPAHKPLLVRLSATDWAEGGWDLDQTVQVCGWLRNEGVDVLDISSGGLTTAQSITPAPAYQAPFAARIRAEVPDVAVITVGMIDTPERAEGLLQNGDADLIALARPHLSDPHWVQWAALRLGAEHEVVPAYARGIRVG